MDPDAKAKPPVLGGLEFEVMDVLWARGECSVREVIPHLSRRLAYTTVMTALDRLFRKGFVERKVGYAFLYSPRFSREEWIRQMVGNLVALSQSQIPAADAASFLVESICQKDQSLLDKLLEKIESKRQAIEKRKEP